MMLVHTQKLWLFVLHNLWTSLSYRLAMALGIASGVIGLLQFALMGIFLQEGNTFPAIAQYGGNILAFLITGSVFTAFVGMALSTFGAFVRLEMKMGTLEHLLVSRTPLVHLMLYEGLMNFLATVVSASAILTILVLLFGVPLQVNLLGVAASLLLLIFALLGMGLASAGILLVSKQGDPITWVFTTLTGLLSGVLYPVAILPAWLQTISWTLPTTQALHALRLSLTGAAGPDELAAPLGALLLWGAISLPLGALVLRWGLNQARRQGSLGEF
jgi:ABC-2 type transport system permease protein